MINFSNVTYRYPKGISGVEDLTLKIPSGQKCAIIGNNGSGKTTFALLSNGLLKAGSGQIEIDALNPAIDEHSRQLKRKIGLVFQNPDNQLVAATVEREIAFTLENLNISRPEMIPRVNEMLQFFGLEDKRERLTSQLSGGEKQKLALASVMAAEPEILILDEPGSFLDESGRRILHEALERLLQSKPALTVIRITQYSHIAEQYPQVLVFVKGRMTAIGAPDEIFGNSELCSEAGLDIPLKYRTKSGSAIAAIAHTPKADNCTLREIKLKDIDFSYDNGIDDSRLFDGLSIAVDNRSVYGLVGPSGSGKSTLIQLMSGLLKPAGGEISYSGFGSGNPRLAVSFQHPERQFFLETVEKEIRFGAENFKVENIDSTVRECYESVGLDAAIFARRDPFDLSGGEKRRLAFAVILSTSPVFVFFDEPTGGLDSDGINHFRNLVASLQKRGVGVVIISHYGNIIFDLCEKIITLRDGQIKGLDEKKRFFEKSAYRDFLSEPEIFSFQIQEWGRVRHYDWNGLWKELAGDR